MTKIPSKECEKPLLGLRWSPRDWGSWFWEESFKLRKAWCGLRLTVRVLLIWGLGLPVSGSCIARVQKKGLGFRALSLMVSLHRYLPTSKRQTRGLAEGSGVGRKRDI